MSKQLKAIWWKAVCIALLLYTVIYGFKVQIPELAILNESIRNLFFHVPMWFAMMFMMFLSLISSVIYLAKSQTKYDTWAAETAKAGFIFGCLGIATGMVWARVTWGAWWVFEEVKLNGAAAGLLIYAAYFILRGSFTKENMKARFSAVYNIFAFVMYMVLINVIPRITDSSLHPGNGGNPGFNSYDLDNNLRTVFYPAVIGWTFLALWIASLKFRIEMIKQKRLDNEA